MTTPTPYEAFRASAAQDVRDAMLTSLASDWAENAVDRVVRRYVTEYLRARESRTEDATDRQGEEVA